MSSTWTDSWDRNGPTQANGGGGKELSGDSRRSFISFNGFELVFRTIKSGREDAPARLRTASMKCEGNASRRIQRFYEELTGFQRGCSVTGDKRQTF